MPNAERNAMVPPPIPEDAKRPKLEVVKGPPPIPEDAKRMAEGAKRNTPPPIPAGIREASIRKSRELIASKDVQKHDVVEAFDVQGFEGLSISATLEKKDERKGDTENNNEDNVLLDAETGLFGVLDGLGGEGSGDKASKAAEANIPNHYKAAMAEITKMDGKTLQDALVNQQLAKLNNSAARASVTEMTEGILLQDMAMGKKALALLESIRRTNDNVKESGGKTTATIGLVHKTPDGKRYAVIGNIGDGAAFKRRENGEIVQLTEEDSALNTLKRAGIVDEAMFEQMKAKPSENFPVPLTLESIQALGGGEEQLKQFQAKGVKSLPMSYKKLKLAMTAALGSESFEPSLIIRELRQGEELILGTDGLVDKLEDPVTEEIDYNLMKSGAAGSTMSERISNLRKTAKDNTKSLKKDDDIGIIAVAIN